MSSDNKEKKGENPVDFGPSTSDQRTRIDRPFLIIGRHIQKNKQKASKKIEVEAKLNPNRGRKSPGNKSNARGNFKNSYDFTRKNGMDLKGVSVDESCSPGVRLKHADSNKMTCNKVLENKTNLKQDQQLFKTKKQSQDLSDNELLNYPEDCSNPHMNQIINKNKQRKNGTSKGKNFLKNKLKTFEMELKAVSKDGSSCSFEKILEMLSDLSIEYDVLIGFINLTCKICAEESTRKLELLQLVFHKHFLDAILKFMQQKTQELTKSTEGIEKCTYLFQKFLHLSTLAIKLLPATSLIFLKHTLVFTRTILQRLEGRINITQEHFDFNRMMIQIEEKAKKEELKKEEVSLLEIEKMKNRNILPTVEDLFEKPPELKKNIIEGAYKNTDHYLTVQFTLLHEDYIAPLREGILEFLSSSSNAIKRKTQVAVYHHIRIIGATVDSGRFGHVIQIDEKIKWEVVLRFFIFGSLLLFTADYFKSFFIGIVIDANKESRTITVKLDRNYNYVCTDIYTKEFVMAVSKVFFEPYFHVLSALKNMASEELPMKKYIVEVRSESQHPAYIDLSRPVSYKLYDQTAVDILNPCWPQFTTVKFNPSQLRAFQAALTNEFVTIQGPPGTGKTFLGLQIVSALLDNVVSKSPILVVCYKNHALDQFLEGILCKTENIIRIGGRSKNENLKKFNLRDLRGSYGYKVHEEFLKTLAISYLRKKYQKDGLKKRGIVSLRNVLPYVLSSEFKSELMSINFENWLMEGVYIVEECNGDNEDILYGIDGSENVNTAEPDEKVKCDKSRTGLQNPDQTLCSSANLEYKEPASGEIKCAMSNTFINDERSSFSEESKKRCGEMYIDDYSNIYCDIAETVLKEYPSCSFENDDVAEAIQGELFNGSYKKTKDKIETHFETPAPNYTLTIRSLKEKHCKFQSKTQQLLDDERIDKDERKRFQSVWETRMQDLTKKISFLKRMLGKKFYLQSKEIEKIYARGEKYGLWALSNNQRWLLYHSWLNSLAEDIKEDIVKLEDSICFGEKRLDEARSKADLEILRRTKIVGVTTTGAAKNRSTLNKLGASIVIIEEAAEVLESHIVTSLSSSCQHLILIGDHKQLRPNPAVYRLCKKYNFDVSLFERMVRNGLSCHTLEVQHRMRPEFAALIVPSIYPYLVNHSSTENRPDIRGVHSNLYFVSHNHPEEKLLETESHSNKFEAKFVLELANYLLLQGYTADDVTILATYNGQVKKIIKMRDQIIQNSGDLRISTVDDFQGEENRIIILSLVRSNEEGKIGFLETENRVCVALSRAREGLYIIGNMDCLTENSQIWPQVKGRLLEHNALGQTLSVYCQNHLETVTPVKDGGMFKEMPEGGCLRMCDMKLSCGHVCKYHCHPRDQQHVDLYMCLVPCERTCKSGHLCDDLCGIECPPCRWRVEYDLACGHTIEAACSSDPAALYCRVIVPCTLACGHDSTKYCSETMEQRAKRKCESVCDKRMPCGHFCPQGCGHKSNRIRIINLNTENGCYPCQAEVDFTRDCGHKIKMKCSEKESIFRLDLCYEEVEITLECEHKVTIKCCKTSEKILCNEVVEKTLTCGHTHSFPCNYYQNPNICTVEVEKTLKCQHTKLVACGEPTDDVVCSLNVLREASCGHRFLAECGLPRKSLVCKEPCARLLKCGHVCKKICSKPCFCSFAVEKELSCGHKVNVKCGSANNVITCTQPCERELGCGHKCEDKCGVKCDVTKCNKTVMSKVKPACGHGRLMGPCFYNNIGPKLASMKLMKLCEAVCGAKLQCGHHCTGECRNCIAQHAHVACSQPCTKVFLCGHRCLKQCYEECGVCNEKCLNRCNHGKCDRICGEPCDLCQEPCERGCIHKRCRRPCFAFCDRRPCSLPCPLQLACGHQCLGFCGERCPPICLQCDSQHLLALRGNANLRLVILEDCGHIGDAARLDAYIYSNKYRLLKCPVLSCQVPIVITKRYHNNIVEAFSSIMKIKWCREGNQTVNFEPVKEKPKSVLKAQGGILGDLPSKSSQNVVVSRNSHLNSSRASMSTEPPGAARGVGPHVPLHVAPGSRTSRGSTSISRRGNRGVPRGGAVMSRGGIGAYLTTQKQLVELGGLGSRGGTRDISRGRAVIPSGTLMTTLTTANVVNYPSHTRPSSRVSRARVPMSRRGPRGVHPG